VLWSAAVPRLRTALARACAAPTLVLLAGCGGGDDASAPARPNVLLVTLDPTRADALGCYGDPHGASPVVDGLAREGVLFEEAFSPAPVTLPAHTTILTGLDPPRHTVRDNALYAVPAAADTLAEVLGEEGYSTFAVVASIVLLADYGIDQGFDVFDAGNLSIAGTKGHEDAERQADEIATAALGHLDAAAPWFGWVHFYDPHQPLRPPADLAQRFGDDLYFGEIAAADRALGRILDGLRARGILDDTLVVVTADHGEGRGEHGEMTHGYLLHDATQHVPLVFRHPSLAPERVEDTLARLSDVFPTILDFVGVPAPAGLDGRSLLSRLQGAPEDEVTPAYLEAYTPFLTHDFAPLTGVRTRHWKLVRGGRVQLFDLRHDPGELHDLAAADPEVRDGMLRQLEALERRGPALGEEPRTLTGVELELLGGIGYAAGLARKVEAGTSDLPDPYDSLGAIVAMKEAEAAWAAGQRADAVRRAEEVVAQYPRTLLFRQTLGAWYGMLGQPGKALAQFEAAVAEHPESLDNRKNAALAAYQVGRPERAIEHLEAAIALPHCPPKPFFFLLWQAYQDGGRKADAARVMTQLLGREGLDPAVRQEAEGCLERSR